MLSGKIRQKSLSWSFSGWPLVRLIIHYDSSDHFMILTFHTFTAHRVAGAIIFPDWLRKSQHRPIITLFIQLVKMQMQMQNAIQSMPEKQRRWTQDETDKVRIVDLLT